MLPVFVLVLLLGYNSPARPERTYSALRFGQTVGDSIRWSPDMREFRTRFTVCAWLRKRYTPASFHVPIVLQYKTTDNKGIYLGDDGFWNWVVGTNLYLKSKYTVPDREWFNVCWTWGTYTLTVYLNGEVIGTEATSRRELTTGGRMSLGNAVGNGGSQYIFGGDLYKLNIFNRVLSQSEIRSMASDMCSTEEERLNTNRILKWEDIILKERTGNVTDISTGCYVQKPRTEPQPRPMVTEETKSETEQELTKTNTNITLNDILKRLQNTERELAETKANLSQRLDNFAMSLTSTQDKLNNTEQELAATKNNLERSEEKLDEVSMSLTSTQVKLNSTAQELARTRNELQYSEEKLESVTISLNHTLEQLEAAKKDRVRSKWDVLYSDKFLNKKLTREMSLELKSTGNMLDLFVGMNLTEELITYLKRHHEEGMVCLNTGN